MILLSLLLPLAALAQTSSVKFLQIDTSRGLTVPSFADGAGSTHSFTRAVPLFTFELNDSVVSSADARGAVDGDSIRWRLPSGIEGAIKVQPDFARGWKAVVTFRNSSSSKQRISNVVPLGEAPDHVYIKSWGPSDYNHRLSRSHLFRPGQGPVGVVLPDDAWEMGFCDVASSDERSLTAIARRTESGNADVRRFRTILEPGGFVRYVIYVDQHAGDWREGLRMMFRDRWIYDLEEFDNALFERPDLSWIRHSYLLLLQFAWDHEYYDAVKHQYNFDHFLRRYEKLLGGFEAYMIWPTWPRLGLDQRNQWDMYRDLPGGVKELHRQAEFAHSNGTRYFIAYNPWDESTRKEEHLQGMADMLRTVDADGVVLDTWGESSREFQAAADRVKPGIILYSEGMAVPRDMPGIVAGRVHDAIFLPPPLNLNKLIKPDFAIFRVIQLAEGRIHREVAVALFNGYGCELNIMRPGRPDWIEEEFTYLGKATQLLRDNSSAFLSRDWTPLLSALGDSIWVNEWPTKEKTLYTVYNLRPDGWNGPLFEVPAERGRHYVSLWNHTELEPAVAGGRTYLPAAAEGFSRAWLDTRREGTVDCIAGFPAILSARLSFDSLQVEASRGTKVVVWAGLPSYHTPHKEYPTAARTISLLECIGTYEGNVVVQAFDGTELLDERVVNVPLAMPRLMTRVEKTKAAKGAPKGMVEIPAGSFVYKPSRSFLSPNEVIPYPGDSTTRTVTVPKIFMDEVPVTNEQFFEFLRAAKYHPADPTNFLKHWVNGRPPKGQERHPVVWVGLDDARAYARWAGKRLPTEAEWQYAAQGSDARKYPWGNTFDSTRCNSSSGKTTPVDAFPAGKSPFGVMDLIGNVWQLTNDVYDNGTFCFGMIRGGSYFNPTSSWWYIPGGPQPADNPQILLMVSPGFDRCATVGFRCVKDAMP